jgi:Fic family protein
MKYIHERAGWPSFLWDEKKLMPVLAEVRHRQGRLIGKMLALGFQRRAEAALTSLAAEILKSNAIEGNVLNAEEVRSSIARRLGLDAGGVGRVGRDVEGVVELMIDATRNFADELTAERLLGWHACLFPSGRSGMRKVAIGAWRGAESGPMQVVSGPIGRERVHFEAPAAERLPAEMARFLQWFSGNREDPVIQAGVSHFWFVTIHPFEDGNGRMARAIAEMALARADGLPERFYSMSSRIEAERQDYYSMLEKCQKGGLDITHWLEWFLGCLGRALDDAEKTIEAALRRAEFRELMRRHDLNARQAKVLDRLIEGFSGKLTSSKYGKIARCSADTALRDIKHLLNVGLLGEGDAGGRSTAYFLREDFATPGAVESKGISSRRS